MFSLPLDVVASIAFQIIGGLIVGGFASSILSGAFSTSGTVEDPDYMRNQ